MSFKEASIIKFWSRKVVMPSGCWEWQGAKTSKGYGHLSMSKQPWLCHRLAYKLTNGEIPNGLFVCHTCDNPACYNPEHLFLGTVKDNAKDMVSKGRNHRTPGEKCSKAKLTWDRVGQMRQEHKTGQWTWQDLALRYGVDRTTARQACLGRSWKEKDYEEAL